MAERSDREKNDNEFHQFLVDLRQRLVSLHKTLIDSERASYEQTFGTVESSNRFLQLLLQDPWFAWLRPLSGLVVQLDEALEGKEAIDAAQARQFADQTRGLLKTSEEGDGFPRSYFDALQREPDVVLAHAEVAKSLNSKFGKDKNPSS